MYPRGVEYHYAISLITLSSSAFLTALFAPTAEDPGFDSRLHKGGRGGGGGGSGSSPTSDLKIGTQVAALRGTWRYKVSAGTGWPGISILWLGEVECLICNFCLSVAASKRVWSDTLEFCKDVKLQPMQTDQRQASSVSSATGTVIPASDWPATPDTVPEQTPRAQLHRLWRLKDAYLFFGWEMHSWPPVV